MRTEELRGKTAVVTGAAGTMGRAVAAALRADGLRVVGLDVKPAKGCVVCDISDPDAVEHATAAMLTRVAATCPGARLDGALVQAMAGRDGVEMLLGMIRDPQFGPLVVVGLGGVLVEVLDDIATRLAPFGATEARAMLSELRMAPLLRGVRGRPAVALDALAEGISRFSYLVDQVPDLAELEINPLVATATGIRALDVRGRVTASKEDA